MAAIKFDVRRGHDDARPTPRQPNGNAHRELGTKRVVTYYSSKIFRRDTRLNRYTKYGPA